MEYPVTVTTFELNNVQEILQHQGAVLLRDAQIDTIEKFASIAKSLGNTNVDMSCSAGPRVDQGHDVFTSNEAPCTQKIPVHHEMAQCDKYPSFVLFYCQIAPTRGGCTPVMQSSAVCEKFKKDYPKIYEKLSAEGVRYLREYPATTTTASPLGKSWRETFSVATPSELESKLNDLDVEWNWMEHDTLRVIGPITHIFRTHDDKNICFMAAETTLSENNGRAKKMLVHANKESFDTETTAAFQRIGMFAYDNAARFEWQPYDVLILNNKLVMHARDPYEGPRRILVSLVE